MTRRRRLLRIHREQIRFFLYYKKIKWDIVRIRSKRLLPSPPHAWPPNVPLVNLLCCRLPCSPRRLWIRRVQSSIVRRVRGGDVKLHCAVALSVCARWRTLSLVWIAQWLFASRHIDTFQRAVEDLEGSERLVEGHFVACLVDADEREKTRLPDLAVHNVVRRSDVDEASLVIPLCANLFCDN